MSEPSPPRYDTYTTRLKVWALEARLRSCWDVLALADIALKTVERAGAPAGAKLFPAEHYLLARIVVRTCTKARRLLNDLNALDAERAAESEARTAYLDGDPPGPRWRAPPSWHRNALGAIRELAAVPRFREVALRRGRFDDAKERYEEGA